MTQRLAGKIAVITGAAGGIGRAIAHAVAACGATVIALDVSQAAVEMLADELGTAHAGMPADVADEASVKAVMGAIESRYDRLDILFNGAGIQLAERDGPVDMLDIETWRRTLDVNLTGTFLCAKHALPLMLKRRSGSIINIGSPTGVTGRGWRCHAYSASKGGVQALTKAMAVAYGARGIRVNVLIPGTIRTGMTRAMLADRGERLDELLRRTALRRLGEPHDLAGAALFLASDDSAYVTGATLAVDGGLLVT